MWGVAIDGDNLRRYDSNTQRNEPNPWHQDQPYATPESSSNDGEQEDRNRSDATNVGLDGTWGEPDTGRTTEAAAKQCYDVLRQDLDQLHRTRTAESRATRSRSRGARSQSRASRRGTSRRGSAATVTAQRVASRRSRRSEREDEVESDFEDASGLEEDSEDDFELGEFMREGHFEKRTDGVSAKRLGLVYEGLTVRGAGSTTAFVRTVPDAVLGTFGPDLYKLITKFMPSLSMRKEPQRTLINDFTGVVRPGEMMLVLGRPGSGCSTFLKAVTNLRGSFAAVEGEVSYGGISAKDQKKQYRGEVTYNMEDDAHFAMLSVWRTLTFALMNKTKKNDAHDIPVIANALMRMFGISHTKHTQVGDDFVRGVSGGERKRVSIAETLASKSSIVAWDNSTRGLDASTALDYARSLRIMTDVSQRTTLVTLYQAGEGIYEVMDKVLVIDEGRQIYSGPASQAKQYFIDLGFECPERQTTADFLTAITDPTERRYRKGFEDRAPKTPEELERAFRESQHYKDLLADVADYKEHLERTNHEDARHFDGAVQEAKSKRVSNKSPYTVSFFRQVAACTKREAWLLLSDTTSLWTRLFIIISCGLIIGSLFYGQPDNTAGLFTRGGVVFFSAVFLGWLQLTELMNAVSGRAIISRHRDYAFYRPSAVALARVVLDFPVLAIQVAIFGVIIYFMTGLVVEAGKFFIYMLFVFTTTIVITALYRMFASVSPEIDTAVRFSGIGLNLLIIYLGYVISKPQLLSDYIWFGWLYWINPLSYSFEALLSNEIFDQQLACAPSQLVPQGPGIDPQYQGCAIAGASTGSTNVRGSDYLAVQYDYSRSNLWRNFGALVAFGILYVLVTVLATETVSFGAGGGGALLFKKSRRVKKHVEAEVAPVDEEKAARSDAAIGRSGSASSDTRNGESPAPLSEEDRSMEQLVKSDSVFTWRDLEYTVPYLGGQKKLLNKVSGYAKPGVMVALMGASGAGKSTLLNTLSQRQTVGVVSGDMLVNGRPLDPDFQRNTGFCLQGDIHDRTQTVREAIEFSAILRQDSSIPRQEKIDYVNKVIDLLELNDLQDAVIISLGVEQRKRLTIGVELAAKPSLLLFLDEPTSGLDSQSAYSIVRFLKKLARAGQAIVCTIHQPSSVLIQQFDMVLALNPGGNTFYFGPMGQSGEHIVKYFADRGAVCPPGKNIAEFVLETAARPHRRPDGSKITWNTEWRSSKEAQAVLDEIDSLQRTQSRAAIQGSTSSTPKKEFAVGPWLQATQLTKRMFRQHWRNPSYVYGKLFTAVIMGIFNGFTFWQLGNSIQDMQNRMFTCLIIVMIPPTVVNAVVPAFYNNLAIWQAREYPSRIYGWFAFCTANIVTEIPVAIVSGTLYWVLWYWPTGLPTESSVSGYSYLMTILMFLFMNSWGQWICAFAPSFTVISNVSAMNGDRIWDEVADPYNP
jgi:ABC-type multidrug transport system ATPase subunit